MTEDKTRERAIEAAMFAHDKIHSVEERDREAMEAAIAAYEAALGPLEEWQPMETAPMDGTQVLLYCEGHTCPVIVGFYQSDESGEWWQYAEPHHAYNHGMIDPAPVAWVRIPSFKTDEVK